MAAPRVTGRQVVYTDASLHTPQGKKEAVLSGLLGSTASAAGGHSAQTQVVTEEAGTGMGLGGGFLTVSSIHSRSSSTSSSSSCCCNSSPGPPDEARAS